MRPIDGTKLKEYLTCSRVPFLSFHLPKSRELPPTERMLVLFGAGHKVEARILAELAPESVKFKRGDWDDGHRATMEAMDRGAPAIANGVLRHEDCLGRPDLLLRDAGGGYEVADIKSASRVHASARVQIAFYSRLLAFARPGSPPPRLGHVILRDGSRESFAIADLAATVDHLLERLGGFRAAESADPGPHRIDACADCRWRTVCAAELESRDDLSLVPGLTRGQKAALVSAGVTTVAALIAEDDVSPIAAASDLSADFVSRLQLRARGIRAGRPLRAGAPRPELRAARFALVALFDDRQTEPAVALAGLVLDEHDKFRVRFLRAREDADADRGLRDLVTNLVRSKGPILVHGGNVERALEATRDRIAALLGPGQADAIDRLEERFIDLRIELRRSVALPGPDRTPVLAARSAGLHALSLSDERGDLAALRWLEEIDDDAPAGRAAIEAMLKRDLFAIDALRRLALELGEAT